MGLDQILSPRQGWLVRRAMLECIFERQKKNGPRESSERKGVIGGEMGKWGPAPVEGYRIEWVIG